VIDDFAKDYLHGDLREIRETVVRNSTVCRSTTFAAP
jgi:hypothetical protein